MRENRHANLVLSFIGFVAGLALCFTSALLVAEFGLKGNLYGFLMIPGVILTIAAAPKMIHLMNFQDLG